jgi:glucosamine 6-phosphate synthetase-like amidotransferase/phosphosugar isomerase protein
MSGIIGIASTGNALHGVLQGLQQLAQSGHHTCGLVVHGRQGLTPSPPRLHRHRRAQGAAAWLQQLRESPLAQPFNKSPSNADSPQSPNGLNGLHGCVALGHTGPSSGTGPQALQQALPQLSHGPKAHLNSPTRVAVVLHGKLQASPALREALIERDYHFKSDCDVELLAHLIDASCQSDPVQALHRALCLVQGQVCVGVLFHDQPERVFAVRRGGDLHAAASPGLLVWSSHPAALPAGLQTLPVWPDGQVLEVHAHPHGITHQLHS